MAIYRLIRESVFELEAIERMTSAYEHALKVLQLTDRQDPITELVAGKSSSSRKLARLILSDFVLVPSKRCG